MSTPGQLVFDKIERLPDQWWKGKPTDDPSMVWTVWNRSSWYLWGANGSNYDLPIGQDLMGEGMAGKHGPSRGHAHPHFVGIITMSTADLPINDKTFATLKARIAAGDSVIVPIFPDSAFSPTGDTLSLGTGIGSSIPGWASIQREILAHIHALGEAASGVTIPPGLYWPDLSQAKPTLHDITSLADIKTIYESLPVLTAAGT